MTKSTIRIAILFFNCLFSAQLLADFEAGNIENLTHEFQTIELSKTFEDPIVVAGPSSFNEQDAGVVIVDNITSDSFDIRFREWSYLDDNHAAESVSYMVVERGVSTLPSGQLVQAGTADLSSRWTANSFESVFPVLPTLLTTVASSEFAGTVAPRIRSLSKTRFQTRYWQEENIRTTHGTELLNWVAISSGRDNGAAGGQPWETLIVYTDERFKTGNFFASYTDPCVLADINSPTSNPLAVRMRNLTNGSVEVFAQEEQSRDTETLLGNEKISLFVTECAPADSEAPSWGATTLQVSATASSLLIDWTPGATDNMAIASYDILLNNDTIGNTEGTSFLATNLTPGNTYTVEIVARDLAGNVVGISDDFSTLADTSAPNWNTSELQANNIETSSALLEWAPGATDDIGVAFYTVTVDGALFGTTQDLSFELTGLPAGTTQTAAITASDAAGNNSAPLEKIFTTPAPPDTSAPNWNSTALLNTGSTPNTLSLSWAPGATDNIGVVAYRVAVDGDDLQTLTANSYTVESLQPQTTYEISIYAIDLAGNETVLVDSFTTEQPAQDTENPIWVATDLSVTNVTEDSFSLSWAPGATDNTAVSQYEVFLNGASAGTTANTSLDINSLTPMTTYSVEVIASDAAENSATLTGSATTSAEPPATGNPVETGMALAITDQFTTINFESYFADPVVVAGPASSIDPEPGVVVIDNITNTSFDIRFREWNYQDGFHGPEDIFYMVVERGTTTLPSGAVIEADTAQIGSAWNTIQFGRRFSSPPVVLNTVASANDVGTIAPRLTSLGRTSFRSRYWLEEGNNTAHAPEDLNWIAIDTGSHDGTADGFAWETVKFNTDEIFRAASFSNAYQNVCVLGDINSLTPNPSTLRHRNLDGAGVEMHVQEETAKDTEVLLGLETIALFVSECVSIDRELPIWQDGSLEIVNATPFSVDLLYSGATDNVDIDYYELFQNGVSIGISQTQLFSVTDLAPATTYNFLVEAVDVLGNVSVDGPNTIHTTATAPTGKIEGTLWLDSNSDSLRGEDEAGIASATVTLALDDGDTPGLINASNTIVETLSSAADGSYSFDYLPANNYLVSPTAVVGYTAESPVGPVSITLSSDEVRSAIEFPFSIDPNAIIGTPFGVFAQISRIESLFPKFNTLYFLLGSPEEATYYLNLARLTNTRMIINLALNYRNPSGTLNLDSWKADLDAFADFDFSPWVNDGTIIAHYLIDEPKARGSWGGQVIHNQTLDDMAEYSKQLWPYMPTTLRMQPTKLLLHGASWNTPIPGWQWEHLDGAWAQYNSRQVANVNNYIAAERQSAIDQNLGLVFGLQAMVGGNGSSGLHPEPPFNTTKWTMSASEIVNYSTAMLQTEFACAFIVFRYDRFEETHFERPEIAQAMDDVKGIAENYQPGSCGLRD